MHIESLIWGYVFSPQGNEENGFCQRVYIKICELLSQGRAHLELIFIHNASLQKNPSLRVNYVSVFIWRGIGLDDMQYWQRWGFHIFTFLSASTKKAMPGVERHTRTNSHVKQNPVIVKEEILEIVPLASSISGAFTRTKSIFAPV